MVDSKVDDEIEKYLPVISKKLEHLDKESLIKHFVSVEFNRFLSFYKNSPDLNSKKRINTNSQKNENLVRLHMNIGKKNGVGAQHILGLLNDKIKKRNIYIGKIDIMKSFLFFEIEKEMENLVFKKINNQNWRGKIKIRNCKRIFTKTTLKKKKKKKKKKKIISKY